MPALPFSQSDIHTQSRGFCPPRIGSTVGGAASGEGALAVGWPVGHLRDQPPGGFTFGAQELGYGRQGQEKHRFRPFQVEIESSLGAGDSFKAGAIYALCKGMDDTALVRFASATAAAACLNYPIAQNPPGLEAVAAIAGEGRVGGD